MDTNIYLDKEFDKFWHKIESGENFVLMRNGDGERAIMTGKKVVAQEGWESPHNISKLGEDILKTLQISNDRVFIGISCPCCDAAAYYWYTTRAANCKNITFANMWVNANYPKFKKKFPTLTRDAVLIANHAAKGHKIGNLNILKHYEVSDDCISFWDNEAYNMVDNIKKEFGDKKNILYVVSAGPMSSPIITELFKYNPHNCYIDFGSSIDIYFKPNFTRPYMESGTKYAERNCWIHNHENQNFDVSVILNLYKRPENLEIQLNAIKKQTLKPKEILLYQDGTGDTVKIPEHLQKEFDFIEINPQNIGVWGRFKFAMENAKSKYVSVFDDDTIPGERWLENCHTEMLKKEGLYGTIGILLKNPYEYPHGNNKNYYRVGWDGELNYTAEVDFVGHSWFFRKDWIEHLFEAPEEIQKYKLVGEDMSFSYQLLKHDIKTYVPPHPSYDTSLHGSLKEYAYRLGTTKSGISVHPSNTNSMREAISILLDKEWNILLDRNPNHISNTIKRLSKKEYIKYLLRRVFFWH
ncbi:MAG: glycosyltransferase family 2 protein [Campylobacteraceae bacterium]|nr:glycosyltransferase family 2 protein [Campylobacteraceae bacterium]